MYKLCSQHLQSLNSVQQKLFGLQPLKDLFQMHPKTWPTYKGLRIPLNTFESPSPLGKRVGPYAFIQQ